MIELYSNSVDETKAFGKTLAPYLKKGDTLVLSGDSYEPWLRLVSPKTRSKLRSAFTCDVSLVYSFACVSRVVHDLHLYLV